MRDISEALGVSPSAWTAAADGNALLQTLREFGNGRAIITATRGVGESGHAFNAVMRNGEVVLIDGQAGGITAELVDAGYKKFYVLRTQ